MIGIYYIATDTYKCYINGFIESIKNFRVGKKKKIILLIDELQESIIDTNDDIEQHIISDAPWPIIALLKMWYINKYKQDFEEVYYFNANAQVVNDLPDCEDKLLLTRHTHADHTQFDGHKFMAIQQDNPNSLSYIGYHDYTYVQGGFFGGKAEIVYKMCESVSKWVESDLKRCVIPKWHDESYLNKWHTLNLEKCKVIRAWDYITLIQNKNFKPKK